MYGNQNFSRKGTETLSGLHVDQEAVNALLARVFNWMAIGLCLTGFAAFLTASSPYLLQIIFGNKAIFLGLIVVELCIVFYLSARVHKLSPQTATGIFIGYAILNGLTIAAIFLLYTMSSIASTFFITAGMFGAMAIYGRVTKRDLTGLGSFMIMGLFGIIIASVVNIFMQSSELAWITSGIGVIVFTGLTAYDVQKIARIGASGIMQQGEAAIQRTAIMGALSLYLDFINLFLSLLQLMGNRR